MVSIATLLQVLGKPTKPLSVEKVTSFFIDSRKVNSGGMFFAIEGEKSDGHDYLKDVQARGACAAVVEKGKSSVCLSMPVFEVEDVSQALATLAKTALNQRKTKVIGITGSVGKTSTKDYIFTFLQKKFKVFKTPGNANTQLTVPLNVLNASIDRDFLILEMGMSKKGQIKRLVDIAPPTIAILTTISLVHAEFFESLEGIAHEKAQIFSHPQTQQGIFCQNIPFFEKVFNTGSCRKKVLIKGCAGDYELCEKNISFYEDSKRVSSFPFPDIGRHHLDNFALSVFLARFLGVSWEEIKLSSKDIKPGFRRFNRIEKNAITFIDDSYNASLLSVKGALSHLPLAKKGGRRFAVLAEMLELGKFSESCHQEVAQHALSCVDELVCLGSACRPMLHVWEAEGRKATLFEDKKQVKAYLKGVLQKGDVVLLKGSRHHQLEELLS